MNKKKLLKILLGVLIIVLAVTAWYFVAANKLLKTSSTIEGNLPPNPGAGSDIGGTDDGTIIKRVGDREGSFLIQKINADSVEGLWYKVYPVGGLEGIPKTLLIGDDIGYACEGVSEKLVDIDFSGQKVSFVKTNGKPPVGGCPICLAGSTLIDTPSGQVPVKDLQAGMPVWTTDKAGQRVPGVVMKTSKVPVLLTHRVVHLVLGDGRELLVSPGHPTADGRAVEDLSLGDQYDNAFIKNTELVSYGEEATYDLLPSGETGFYWANNILLGSTLKE